MSQKDIERAALNGEPIPKDLKVYDTMLYYMLSGLYARYRARLITQDEARQHKQVILSVYQRVKNEYEQFTAICKQYQEVLKNASSGNRV